MAEPDLQTTDPLADFEGRQVTLQGTTKLVFVAGTGPAVIVMTEMPGITPHVARFARWIRDAGFTVWMPNLFGEPGHPISTGYTIKSIFKACIGSEFRAFAANASSPVTQWLRALAAHAHPLCGGKGVGAIGMCTGLPDSAANPDSPMKNPHSVVTLHLIDEQSQPTRKAVAEIIDFFRMRLG